MRLYRSTDLREWHDEGVFAEAEDGKGFMWNARISLPREESAS